MRIQIDGDAQARTKFLVVQGAIKDIAKAQKEATKAAEAAAAAQEKANQAAIKAAHTAATVAKSNKINSLHALASQQRQALASAARAKESAQEAVNEAFAVQKRERKEKVAAQSLGVRGLGKSGVMGAVGSQIMGAVGAGMALGPVGVALAAVAVAGRVIGTQSALYVDSIARTTEELQKFKTRIAEAAGAVGARALDNMSEEEKSEIRAGTRGAKAQQMMLQVDSVQKQTKEAEFKQFENGLSITGLRARLAETKNPTAQAVLEAGHVMQNQREIAEARANSQFGPAAFVSHRMTAFGGEGSERDAANRAAQEMNRAADNMLKASDNLTRNSIGASP